jgi:PhzF family phenazine biosynthesis protein
MPTTFPFHQVDVFSRVPFGGNPLAVVGDGDALDDAQMAVFARWTNLSETTFLLRPTHPDADYRVRIFTPENELPFAGHPTLGSCHVWLAGGGTPRTPGRIVQQCGIGLVRIRREHDRLAFAAPSLRRTGPLASNLLARIAAGLALDPGAIVASQWIDNGPPWIGILLRTRAELLALRPNASLSGLCLGVAAPCDDLPALAEDDARFEVRAFLVGNSVPEDPVTGSLNAGLAQWLIGSGLAPPAYVARQGTALGRAGRVHIHQADGNTWVGGAVATCIKGRVAL